MPEVCIWLTKYGQGATYYGTVSYSDSAWNNMHNLLRQVIKLLPSDESDKTAQAEGCPVGAKCTLSYELVFSKAKTCIT